MLLLWLCFRFNSVTTVYKDTAYTQSIVRQREHLEVSTNKESRTCTGVTPITILNTQALHKPNSCTLCCTLVMYNTTAKQDMYKVNQKSFNKKKLKV